MAAALAALQHTPGTPASSAGHRPSDTLISSPFSVVAGDGAVRAGQRQRLSNPQLVRAAYGGFSHADSIGDEHQSTSGLLVASSSSFVTGNPLWRDDSGNIPALALDGHLESSLASAPVKAAPPAARKMPLVPVKQNAVLPLESDMLPLRTVRVAALGLGVETKLVMTRLRRSPLIALLQKPQQSIFENDITLAALPRWKQRSLRFLNSIPYLVFSTLITVIAIFLSDVRLAVTPPSADKFFTVLASLCLVQFAIELVRHAWSRAQTLAFASCIISAHSQNSQSSQVWTSAVKPGYFLKSFWFWLDLISTASLLLDIPALQSSFISAGSSREDKQASTLRAAVRAFQLIRISRLLKVQRRCCCGSSDMQTSCGIKS